MCSRIAMMTVSTQLGIVGRIRSGRREPGTSPSMPLFSKANSQRYNEAAEHPTWEHAAPMPSSAAQADSSYPSPHLFEGRSRSLPCRPAVLGCQEEEARALLVVVGA